MTKRYFLVDVSDVFVDPHGSPDHASGSIKHISNDESLLELDGQYVSDGEIVEEEDLQGSEDGYNSQYESYSVKEITEEQAIKAQEIIDAYNAL